MMRTLSAIARLTLREALRSRVVLVFALLLVLIAGLMPSLIKGDGTPVGDIRLTISYTLGTAFGLLALANLWTGCALISGDIASRTLALTRVKPVSPWQLWCGKWLGLLLLNFLFLAGLYTWTGAIAYHRIWHHGEAAAVMKTAREKVLPVLPALDEQIKYYFTLSKGAEKSGTEQRELLRQLRREIPYQTATLERGQTWNWHFTLDHPPIPSTPIWLRFQFDTDAYTRAIVKAQCRLTGVTSGSGIDFTLDDFSTRLFEVPVSAETFGADKEFTLTMKHDGDASTGPLLLQPRQGLALLVPRETLLLNLLRSATIHFSILALLAAIGITLGTLFSLPAAAFCATGLLVSVLISAFVVDDFELTSPLDPDANVPPVQRVFAQFATETTRMLTHAAQPALAPVPLRQLAAAEQIPLAELRRALLFNILLLPLVCCGMATAALRRRELPS